MLKIGIIGLGDIAQKAYLPVIARRKVEVHLCTRNASVLDEIGDQYRFANLHQSIDSLIKSGIKGAFVSSATLSHYEMVEQLLNNDIPVYVDKPLTYDYESAEKLVELARRKNLLLQVGFNRRFAPAYRQMKSLRDINMIIMQKNRKSLPGDVRTFVFDDFIHVIDTLLYLIPSAIESWEVTGRKISDMLYHVTLTMKGTDGFIAVGIMNRDSGTTEERLEVFTPTGKHVVDDVVDSYIYENKNKLKQAVNDWESTLFKRGFDAIIDDFLNELQKDNITTRNSEAILKTHQICEEVVRKLT